MFSCLQPVSDVECVRDDPVASTLQKLYERHGPLRFVGGLPIPAIESGAVSSVSSARIRKAILLPATLQEFSKSPIVPQTKEGNIDLKFIFNYI